MAKIRTTINIEEEILKEVTKIAEEQERSISQQIVYFIKVGLKNEKDSDASRD